MSLPKEFDMSTRFQEFINFGFGRDHRCLRTSVIARGPSSAIDVLHNQVVVILSLMPRRSPLFLCVKVLGAAGALGLAALIRSLCWAVEDDAVFDKQNLKEHDIWDCSGGHTNHRRSAGQPSLWGD